LIPRNELEALASKLTSSGAAIAKNPDQWSSLDRGGDWDIVVRNLGDADRVVTETLGIPDRATRRSYVWSYHFSWGEIDLLPNIQWRGLELIDSFSLIAQATPGSPLCVARPAHQVIAACIYPYLAYGAYKERYSSLIADMTVAEIRVFAAISYRCFGLFLDPVALLQVKRRKLKRLLLLNALKSQATMTARATTHFIAAELLLRWQTRRRHGQVNRPT
jgi:hypothetical protein